MRLAAFCTSSALIAYDARFVKPRRRAGNSPSLIHNQTVCRLTLSSSAVSVTVYSFTAAASSNNMTKV